MPWAALEGALLVGGFLAALALRAPYLWTEPGISAELKEMLAAFAVYQGTSLPLALPYGSGAVGALHLYLLALVWRLFGPNPELPRLLSLVAGAATVPLVYLLARDLSGRVAGLVAAVLVGTSSFHILVSSHIGHANALTPLLATAGCALLAAALRQRRGLLLALAGLVFGLAVETHVLVLLLLPGAALVTLLRDRSLALSRWAVVACALFLVVVLPFGADVVLRRAERAVAAAEYQAEVNKAGAMGPATYVDNAQAMVPRLGLVLAGAQRVPGRTPSVVADAGALLVLVVGLGALVQQAARGNALPLAMAGPALVALPLLSGNFDLPNRARYLMPMVVLLYVALGGLVADAIGRAQALRWRGLRPCAAQVGVVLLLAVVPVWSLASLAIYYREMATRGGHPEVALTIFRQVRASRVSDEVLTIDDSARGDTRGLGWGYGILDPWLTVAGIPHATVNVDDEWLRQARAAGRPTLALLTCDNVRLAREDFGATVIPIAGSPPDQCVGGVALARIGPASGERSQ